MIEDKAKIAFAAREELARALLECSRVMTATAQASIALAAAAQAEHEATMAYVAALEASLSQQRVLS
ncbi:MAG: hypothetical protein EHM67_10105 [Hyphomicrobiaceae bacterium]|nr:MAG: hypothetical protein EHM67_14905 [Hyphomicrobiaceae bacterium]RPI39539.1 MAG: hypothetical protein EHM67_10105 [Hyphomicrobiaceae bacterium]